MRRLTVAVIIATRGRREIAATLIRHLAAQIRRPDRVVVSVSNADDAPNAKGVEIVIGPPGLAAQRNTGLLAVAGADIAVFFDDDFIPAPGALEAIERLFTSRPNLAGATGHVASDGATGAAISDQMASQICIGLHRNPPKPLEQRAIGLYGCNMAISLRHAKRLTFDEALPLYGWQEDLDFGARLSKRGDIIKTTVFSGVHRGVKSARPREIGLGYAQIANPAYLMPHGDIPTTYLLKLMARNVAANHLGWLRPDKDIDRRGRAHGNWLAIHDIARGQLTPARAADL